MTTSLWPVFTIIFALAWFQGAHALAHLGRRTTMIAISAVAVVLVVMYPLCSRTSLQLFNKLLSDSNVLSTLCTVQIVASVCTVLMTVALFQARWRSSVWRYVLLIDPLTIGVAVCGMLMLQTYLFNRTETIPFIGISLGLAAVNGVSLVLSIATLKRVLDTVESRLELRGQIALVAMIFAMFAPLVVNPARAIGSPFVVELSRSAQCWAGMSVVVLIGFLNPRRKRVSL